MKQNGRGLPTLIATFTARLILGKGQQTNSIVQSFLRVPDPRRLKTGFVVRGGVTRMSEGFRRYDATLTCACV